MDKTTFWSHTAPAYESIDTHSDFYDEALEDHDDTHEYRHYGLSNGEVSTSQYIAEQHEDYTLEIIEVRVFSTVRIQSENTYDRVEKFFKKKR